MTLRQHTLRYSMVSPPMSLILDYLQADSLDKPITGLQDAYLPDELEMQVQSLQVKRADGSVRPLTKSTPPEVLQALATRAGGESLATLE